MSERVRVPTHLPLIKALLLYRVSPLPGPHIPSTWGIRILSRHDVRVWYR